MSTEPKPTQAKHDPSFDTPLWVYQAVTEIAQRVDGRCSQAELASIILRHAKPDAHLAPSAVVPQAPQAGGAELREAIDDAVADLRNLADTFRLKEASIPCADRIVLCTRLGALARKLDAARHSSHATPTEKT